MARIWCQLLMHGIFAAEHRLVISIGEAQPFIFRASGAGAKFSAAMML